MRGVIKIQLTIKIFSHKGMAKLASGTLIHTGDT